MNMSARHTQEGGSAHPRPLQVPVKVTPRIFVRQRMALKKVTCKTAIFRERRDRNAADSNYDAKSPEGIEPRMVTRVMRCTAARPSSAMIRATR
jgi:hypothetical protein